MDTEQKRPRGRPKKIRPLEQPSQSAPTGTGLDQFSESDSGKTDQVTVNDLSATARKAEAYVKHNPDEPMHQSRCRECNGPMWTWGDKEDVCETCGFEIRLKKIENAKLRAKSKKPHNAFNDSNEKQIPVGVTGKKQRKVNPYMPTPEKRAKIPFGVGGHRGPIKNPFASE